MYLIRHQALTRCSLIIGIFLKAVLLDRTGLVGSATEVVVCKAYESLHRVIFHVLVHCMGDICILLKTAKSSMRQRHIWVVTW